MGVWGGADGLLSHLNESSIFKRNLIETSPPRQNLSSFSPDSDNEGDLPLLLSIIPKQCRACVTLSLQVQQVHVQYTRTKIDCYICLSVCAVFAGLNLSFSQRPRKRQKKSE